MIFSRKQPEGALTGRVEALEQSLKDLRGELRDALKALEGLDADLDWLSGQVKTLRGKVTGGERREKTLQDAPGATIAGDPPPLYSPAWYALRRKTQGR